MNRTCISYPYCGISWSDTTGRAVHFTVDYKVRAP